jgi:hypothetical protein
VNVLTLLVPGVGMGGGQAVIPPPPPPVSVGGGTGRYYLPTPGDMDWRFRTPRVYGDDEDAILVILLSLR